MEHGAEESWGANECWQGKKQEDVESKDQGVVTLQNHRPA